MPNPSIPGRMWSVSGRGGTLEFAPDGSTRPGPYYMYAGPNASELVGDGVPTRDLNTRAVHYGVLAIQRALNRELEPGTVVVDGLFGRKTKAATIRWQQGQPSSHNVKPWGGIGPDSSKWLFMPLLVRTVKTQLQKVVCGLVSHESMWDPGCVGYTDPDDNGLGQINLLSNPSVTEEQAFQPKVAFEYIEDILTARLETFDGNLGDAVASYNLGATGALAWIRAGRPDIWRPTSNSSPRNVRAYITNILSGCTTVQ